MFGARILNEKIIFFSVQKGDPLFGWGVFTKQIPLISYFSFDYRDLSSSASLPTWSQRFSCPFKGSLINFSFSPSFQKGVMELFSPTIQTMDKRFLQNILPSIQTRDESILRIWIALEFIPMDEGFPRLFSCAKHTPGRFQRIFVWVDISYPPTPIKMQDNMSRNHHRPSIISNFRILGILSFKKCPIVQKSTKATKHPSK